MRQTLKAKKTLHLAPSRREAGFTLLEMLVVLGIISLIAAFAAPQVLRYLGGARTDSAGVQIRNLSAILDLYRLDNQRYPTTTEGLRALVERPSGAQRWNGPYTRQSDALIDPWGRPYQYRSPGRQGEFDLFTWGADNVEGGTGENRDVVSW